jgi:hypothetical protein
MGKKNRSAVQSDVEGQDQNLPETHLSNVESPELPEAGEVAIPEKKERKPRSSKNYKIALGGMPASNEKPLGVHAVVITEAITELVNEGKESASREEIMERAKANGLYDKKPSVQGLMPIFSWWRKALAGLGWLEQIEVEVVEAAVEAPVAGETSEASPL